MAYGLIVLAEDGTVTMDTSSETFKDMYGVAIGSLTTATTIYDPSINETSEVIVLTNNEALLPPVATLNRGGKTVNISPIGGRSFNAQVRVINN